MADVHEEEEEARRKREQSMRQRHSAEEYWSPNKELRSHEYAG
jgi:hypothetical protein